VKLSAGTKLGPYEILAPLGAGGQTVDRASREFPGDVLALSLKGLLAARAGDARARELAESVARHRRSFGHYHHAQYDLACIHALLGEGAEAAAMLLASAGNGFPCVPFFERDPLLEKIRGGEAYRRLISDLRPEHEAYRSLYRTLRTSSGEQSGCAAG
jgi:hypothetical protein